MHASLNNWHLSHHHPELRDGAQNVFTPSALLIL
jgi:hypothetical protein